MRNRRKVRLGVKVIHRHRVGSFEYRRVSELVFIRDRPRAVLGWIDVGGIRTPVLHCELDPAKLRPPTGKSKTYYYDGVTVDPRYEDVAPAPPRDQYAGPERRRHKVAYSGMERRRSA